MAPKTAYLPKWASGHDGFAWCAWALLSPSRNSAARRTSSAVYHRLELKSAKSALHRCSTAYICVTGARPCWCDVWGRFYIWITYSPLTPKTERDPWTMRERARMTRRAGNRSIIEVIGREGKGRALTVVLSVKVICDFCWAWMDEWLLLGADFSSMRRKRRIDLGWISQSAFSRARVFLESSIDDCWCFVLFLISL